MVSEGEAFDAADTWLPDLQATHGNIAWRDQAYLQWRITDCPYGTHRVYLARGSNRPLGYMVLREDTPRVAAVVEALARKDDDETYFALVDAALRRARAIGKEGVETLEPPEGGFRRALHRLGFLPSLRRPSELDIIAACKDPALEDALFHSSSAWTITLADSDFDMRV